MQYQDFLLVAAVALFVIFLGPFLFSSADWTLLAAGAAIAFSLGYWIQKRFAYHTKDKS